MKIRADCDGCPCGHAAAQAECYAGRFRHLRDVELLIIDRATNRCDVADRIRRSQAEYRLAQGF